MQQRRRPTRAVIVLAALYVLLLAAIGLWPRHVDSGLAVQDWRLTSAIADALSISTDRVVDAAEVLANVVFFVPVGVLVAWALPRASILVAALLGGAVAIVIEIAQWQGPIDRTASVLDVAADVVGAVLGFAAMRAAAGGSRLARTGSWALAVVTVGVLAVLLTGLVVSGS
ncbi:VanZ family protein [Aeromicrobium tamlense]|uniref:Glycopeptide antibiotics resistance protein n=1 Tax=Aeromicrobium tamlense TaxID=375541 RepID=A0A8I0FVT2_9ACTN|nr:VanZ family protein [Aeromicrobium tamlense]MBD1269866.1 VanZ family protein [Aeromicrobium tamlense]NYI39477.1 glycopeptide antibiotics resistance protein [Aeromicrobium tamlense]